MIGKVFKVIIQLYASFRSGLWTGRAVSTGSLKIDDPVALAVSRRTDLNPDTLKAGYMILRALALEQILEGKYVEFDLSHCGLLVGGLFEGDHPERIQISITNYELRPASAVCPHVNYELRITNYDRLRLYVRSRDVIRNS
jgi:hypothetical protein